MRAMPLPEAVCVSKRLADPPAPDVCAVPLAGAGEKREEVDGVAGDGSAFSRLLETLAKVHLEEVSHLRRELTRLGGPETATRSAAVAASAGRAIAVAAAESMVAPVWPRSTKSTTALDKVAFAGQDTVSLGEVATRPRQPPEALSVQFDQVQVGCEQEGGEVEERVDSKLMARRTASSSLWRARAEEAALATQKAGSPNGKALPKRAIPEVWHQMVYDQRIQKHDSWALEVLTAVLVLLNGASIGVFAEYTADNGEEHVLEEYVNTGFTIFFVIELGVRMCMERRQFFRPPNNGWNIFDVVVVGISVMHQIVESILQFTRIRGLSLLRLLRILRLIRLARIIRIVRSTTLFREPRLIILSLGRGFPMLCWVILLNAAMFYVFGVTLMLGTLDDCKGAAWDDSDPLCTYFGTIDRAMMSLFQAISGGVLWADLLEILYGVDFVYRMAFMIYMPLALVMWTNFATALLSKVVVDAAAQQKDDRVADLIRDKEDFIRRMADLFHELDVDGSGSMSIVELEVAMHDPNLDATLASLDLEIADVDGLFDLLDTNGSRSVELDDWILGCLRLRGAARSIELVRMQKTLDAILDGMGALSDSVGPAALEDGPPEEDEGPGHHRGAPTPSPAAPPARRGARTPTDGSLRRGPLLGALEDEALDFELPPKSLKPPVHRPIHRPEERAMFLADLRRIGRMVEQRCLRERWKDMRTGELLEPEDVNLYHLNYHVICPVTLPDSVILKGFPSLPKLVGVGQRVKQLEPGARALVLSQPQPDALEVTVTRGSFRANKPVQVDGVDCGCPTEVVCVGAMSYKEIVSPKPMKPMWYCCHWWGQKVLDFVACVEAQAKLRNIPEDRAAYWICGYANRQHDLTDDLGTDPDLSSFRRAMRVSEGTLLILDPSATPFKRIWCDFELFKTIHSDGKPLDMVTVHKGAAQLLADDVKPLPHESALAKTLREQLFPVALLREGFRSRLEEGDASVQQDKDRILASMASAAPKTLSPTEGLAHVLRQANAALHGRLAHAAWPQAVKKGLVQDFDKENPGTIQLPEILYNDDLRTQLELSLANFKEVTDTEVQLLSRGLPPKLTDLRLNFASCTNVSDTGLFELAKGLPETLLHLHLSFVGCSLISDEGVTALAQKLPKDLQHLRLDFAKCEGITEESVRVLAHFLPPRVSHVFVTLRGTSVNRNFESKRELLKNAGLSTSGRALMSARCFIGHSTSASIE